MTSHFQNFENYEGGNSAALNQIRIVVTTRVFLLAIHDTPNKVL